MWCVLACASVRVFELRTKQDAITASAHEVLWVYKYMIQYVPCAMLMCVCVSLCVCTERIL